MPTTYLPNTLGHGSSRTTQAHDATVSKLSWAHPQFGPILASSSFDRTVKIWEQTYSEPESQANGAKSQNASRWIERAVLVDAKATVRSVEFAPHQFGLKLVSTADSTSVDPLILFPFRPQFLLIISYAFTNV
jgi:WD40 repeat protein